MRSIALAAGLLLTYLLLPGCGNRNTETGAAADAPTANANAAAPATPQASPQDLEAESSLSVKRGVITLTAQTRSFRLCGANVDLTLTDQLDGALDRAYADLGGKPIYAEVYGDRGDVPPGSNASAAFNVEELLYATANNPAAACATRLGPFELLARGSEPTWSVEVHQDSMVFKQTAAPTEIKFTAVETADTEGTVTYRAGADRHVLELVITQRACRDALTNEYYAYSATARIDKQTLNGCARVGE
jgi:uncharacterized membrane protein